MIPFHRYVELADIVARLRGGDELVGPVRVMVAGRKRGKRRWGFESGHRAHAHAVEALEQRGILTTQEHAGRRVARLVEEAT